MPSPAIDSLVAAAAGMSVEQIEQEISQSQHAADIRDPHGLAAYIAKCASDPDFAAAQGASGG